MKLIYVTFVVVAFSLISCGNKKERSNEKDAVVFSPYINYLYKQTAQHPDSMDLRISLMNALDSNGLYKEAIKEVNFLISKDSLNFGFWSMKGHLSENAKDTVEAILSYKRAIRVYPSPDVMLSLANLFAETKNDTALILCVDVIRISPDRKYTADCKFISGIYYSRRGNSKQAIELFDECINERYTYMVAYLEKGFIFYDAKQYNEALKTFQLAASVSNAYADAYYWQAKCYEALSNKAEAVVNYQKALSLDKNLKEAEAALQRLK